MVDGAYRCRLLLGDHVVKVLLHEIAEYALAYMWEEIAEYLDVADEVLYALQEYLAEE